MPTLKSPRVTADATAIISESRRWRPENRQLPGNQAGKVVVLRAACRACSAGATIGRDKHLGTTVHVPAQFLVCRGLGPRDLPPAAGANDPWRAARALSPGGWAAGRARGS